MSASFASHKSTLSPLLALLAPILGLIIYLNVLDNELVDKGAQITIQNPQVTEAWNWTTTWLASTPPQAQDGYAYRPVLATLLRMEWSAWGSSPSSFHSVSLILFVGCIILFLLVMSRIVASPGARLAAGLVFALHPMVSQSVQSVAGQGELLSLGSCLAACLVVQLYRQGRLGILWSTLAIGLLAALAVGSCEMGLLLPFWLMAVAALTEAKPALAPIKPGRRATKPLKAEQALRAKPEPGKLVSQVWIGSAVAVVLICYLLLRVLAMHGVLPTVASSELALQGTAAGPFANGPSVVFEYLWRLLWPIHPTLLYTPGVDLKMLPPAVGWIGLAVLVALTILACLRWKPMGFALIMLLTPLLALSHWIRIPFFMSEGPLLFALPGFCLVLGLLLTRLQGRAWLPISEGLRAKVAFCILIPICGALAYQTWKRGDDWTSAETIWQAEAAIHPQQAKPQIELLSMYMHKMNLDAAAEKALLVRKLARPEELDRAVELDVALAILQKDDGRLRRLFQEELNSTRAGSRSHYAMLAQFAKDNNLASEYDRLLRKELKLYPDAFDALYELAEIERQHKNMDEAIKLGAQAAQNAPADLRANALARYGVILSESGHLDGAVEEFRNALKLNPALYEPYIKLAQIFWGRKEYENALIYLSACTKNVRLASYVDIAEVYTGVLESQKKINEALDWLNGVLHQFSGDVPLQIYAARFMIQYRQYDRAQQIYAQMSSAKGPDLAEVYTGLGLIALEGENNRDRAGKFWRIAIQINPLNDEPKRFLDHLALMSAPQAKAAGAGSQAKSANVATSPTAPAVARPQSAGLISMRTAKPVSSAAPSTSSQMTLAPATPATPQLRVAK